MVLLRSNFSIGHAFSAPFVNKRFGNELRHGTDVANAAYDFNRNVRRKMMQITSIAPASTRTPALSCNVTAGSRITPNTYSIGGTAPILSALREIIRNPDGVDAINMSVVFRSVFCDRADGDFLPDPCENNEGQTEVDELYTLGIPLVVGLENKDIGGQEVTWPACLNNVIKVGNRDATDNSIGVGAMDIDFFALDSISGQRGNSFAALRIATAFAMLKEAVPQSTIEQRAVALSLANTRSRTYDSGARTFTRRDVRRSDIPQAIIELQEIVAGNIDNIFFEDTEEYGPFHGGSSDVYAFNINFDQLIGTDGAASVQANQSLSLSTIRDVALSFEGSSTLSTTFRIFINGRHRATTNQFGGTENLSLVLNRNLFRDGENTIEIVAGSSNWGLRNITADFHPVIELTVGETDSNEYGYSQTPARLTGARAVFELPVIDGDYILSASGWDMDRADENEVFLNGTSLGFLNQGPSSAYATRNNFILRSDLLQQGNNSIEFVQRVPDGDWQGFQDEKWAVRDMRVEQALPDLTASSVRIIDKQLDGSTPFQATATISNVGIGSSIVGSVAHFYASSDKTINSNDMVLQMIPFAPLLENRSTTVNATIQTSLVNQGLYFGVCVDSVPTEGSIGNNCSKAIRLSNTPSLTPIMMMILDDESPTP